MSKSMSSLSTLFLLAFSIAFTTCAAEEKYWIFGLTYEVHVINGFKDNPEPLIIRCQSKDNDLGVHSLRVGEDFNWHFKVNALGTTLFFCNMKWGQKQKSFNVFSAPVEGYNCRANGKCFWLVAEAGFYFSSDHFTWQKNSSWP